MVHPLQGVWLSLFTINKHTVRTMEPEKKRRRARASFLTSAAYFKELPPPEGLEFAVMGRSNVGKSSFINHAFEQQRLAKTSQTPGKTALANLFVVETDSGETPGRGLICQGMVMPVLQEANGNAGRF